MSLTPPGPRLRGPGFPRRSAMGWLGACARGSHAPACRICTGMALFRRRFIFGLSWSEMLT